MNLLFWIIKNTFFLFANRSKLEKRRIGHTGDNW